ncbi:hypothetical protein [Oceanobacillus sp. FSL W7-1309]
MDNAGLVTSKRVGREVRYKVCPEQLSSEADWDRKLEWIKRVAETNNNSD